MRRTRPAQRGADLVSQLQQEYTGPPRAEPIEAPSPPVSGARSAALAKAESVLTVLAARGVLVDEPTRRRVLSCTDSALLDRWIGRAAVATSAAELFVDL